ncbi:MAG: hydrogenase expression/formation protein HypE, partial [Anaerolineales bacterium]
MNQDNAEPIHMQGPVCPIPHQQTETIVMGHGSGGQMTHDLIQNIFHARIGNSFLAEGNDAARVFLTDLSEQISISTDSHVVSPIFFPGGDIGRLAVCGTVNDVAMLGASPAFLTAGFIIEEGFAMASLGRIVDSMAIACQEAGVKIVAGDTKVVEKGNADGVYINTTGFGSILKGHRIGGQYAEPGDAILISGTIGDHGIAVLHARGDLGFESHIQSDVAPLNKIIIKLL